MRIFRSLAGMVVLSGLLAACAPSTPHADPTPVSSAPTGTPTPTADDFLLRITATVTFGDGTVVHLQETAQPPLAGDGSEPGTMSKVGNCDQDGDDGWQTAFPKPSWVHMQLTSAYESGDALPEEEAVSVSGGSGKGYVAWSGAWHNGQAYCRPGYAVIPGTAEGLAPVDAAAPVGDRDAWSGGAWGFALDHERDAPPTMPISFTECHLELGPAAAPAASILTRWPAVDGYAQDCIFGPQN